MRKCLLIKTHDNRKLFIRKTSGKGMEEFAKVFKTKVSIVELLDPKEKILSDKEFKIAFCDPNHTSNAKYKIIEKNCFNIKPNPTREQIRRTANKITCSIYNELVKGKVVSLQDLKKKYQNETITPAHLSGYFSKARKELSEEGFHFEKMGAGKWKIHTST
jgi:hypothetical protein